MSYINDGGHGGTDPGAVKNGNVEKVYTLEASLYVDKRLKEHGIKSTNTRTTDIGLDSVKRTNIVKNSGADFCLSHHFNGGGGSGFECIHSIHSNGAFEKILVEEIKSAGYPLRNRPIFTRKGTNGADFYFMHRMTGAVQTTIIEYEFVDGPQSEKIKNKEYRVGMYEAVVKAVCRFRGITYKPIKKPAETKQTTNSATFFRVVTGSFSDRSKAEARIAELKKANFDSFIDIFKTDGRTFHRVVTGSFANRPNAVARMEDLKKKGFDSFIDAVKG